MVLKKFLDKFITPHTGFWKTYYCQIQFLGMNLMDRKVDSSIIQHCKKKKIFSFLHKGETLRPKFQSWGEEVDINKKFSILSFVYKEFRTEMDSSRADLDKYVELRMRTRTPAVSITDRIDSEIRTSLVHEKGFLVPGN